MFIKLKKLVGCFKLVSEPGLRDLGIPFLVECLNLNPVNWLMHDRDLNVELENLLIMNFMIKE